MSLASARPSDSSQGDTTVLEKEDLQLVELVFLAAAAAEQPSARASAQQLVLSIEHGSSPTTLAMSPLRAST